MRGASRIMFAWLAAALRAFAWIPTGIGKWIEGLADRCEDRAKLPQEE